MDNNVITESTLSLLKNTKTGDCIKKAFEIYYRVCENSYAMVTTEDSDELKAQKIGTILVFSTIKKIQSGVSFKDFSKEDWKDIADDISKYAILMDGEKYSAFVFLQYANYIEASANFEPYGFTDKAKESLHEIVNELRFKTKQLEENTILEVNYTEECLWLCLEAMIKMLSGYKSNLRGAEAKELAQAISMFAFEYGRYKLYAEENERLTSYLEGQKNLDIELDKRFEETFEYIKEKSDEFYCLVDNAFDSDFRNAFRGSVELAKSAGVNDNEVLDDVKKVDDFFM